MIFGVGERTEENKDKRKGKNSMTSFNEDYDNNEQGASLCERKEQEKMERD